MLSVFLAMSPESELKCIVCYLQSWLYHQTVANTHSLSFIALRYRPPSISPKPIASARTKGHQSPHHLSPSSSPSHNHSIIPNVSLNSTHPDPPHHAPHPRSPKPNHLPTTLLITRPLRLDQLFHLPRLHRKPPAGPPPRAQIRARVHAMRQVQPL